MTPQILLDALRKAFVSLEKVRLLIFDECHHATGNHPYTKIMKVITFVSRNSSIVFVVIHHTSLSLSFSLHKYTYGFGSVYIWCKSWFMLHHSTFLLVKYFFKATVGLTLFFLILVILFKYQVI